MGWSSHDSKGDTGGKPRDYPVFGMCWSVRILQLKTKGKGNSGLKAAVHGMLLRRTGSNATKDGKTEGRWKTSGQAELKTLKMNLPKFIPLWQDK